VGTLEMAAAKKEGIFPSIKGSPSGTANPVANLVTGYSAKHHRQKKPLKGNDARVGEDSGGDQKRVAWKKKPDEEACFNKNDGANEWSAPGAD
jgi:hypothetical protein